MSESGARQALVSFLARTFDGDELRRWVRDNYERKVHQNLPGEESTAGMASDVVDVLHRVGAIDRAFFTKLRAERPRRADEIRALERAWLDGAPLPAGRGPRVSPVAPGGGRPRHDFRLSVLLDCQNDVIEARYQLPGGDPLPPRRVLWSEVAPSVAAATRALDSGDERAIGRVLETARDDLGGHLFRILFGDVADWEPVLRAVFGQTDPASPRPNPGRRGVRLAVVTSDPALASLPWRLATWNRRPLVRDGWRFAVSRQADPPGDHTMSVPVPVILVAPRIAATTGPAIPAPNHARALRDVLAAVWPTGQKAGYLRTVHTRSGLDNALRGVRSGEALVYIHTAALPHRGRPCLVLDDPDDPETPDLLPVEALSGLFERTGNTPRLVYLDTAGAPLRDPLADAEVPLVVWRPNAAWAPRSALFALDWLQRWLGHGGDPVDALHHVATRDSASDLATCSEAATLAVRVHYRTWNTQRYARARRSQEPLDLVDRDEPKALIVRHLRELAHSPTRRVLAVVAHAEPGNRIADLCGQLRHELDVQGESVVAINWRQVTFPEQRHQLAVDLPAYLEQDLAREPGEPIAHLLRRHAPTVRGTTRRVLWLDWGACGDGLAQAKLSKHPLVAWLRFASEFLAAHCPDDLRVVAYLAMQVADPDKLSRALNGLYREPWAQQPAFQLDEVRPGRVSEKHLLGYLRDHTSCDPALHIELAQLIMEATDGDFARTVAWLDRAAGSEAWYALPDLLRRELGKPLAAPPDDDEDY